MKKARTNLLQGTLFILPALAPQVPYGLDVSNRIAQITKGSFDVKPGSLFPALHRMEEAGQPKTAREILLPHPRRPAAARDGHERLDAHLPSNRERAAGDLTR